MMETADFLTTILSPFAGLTGDDVAVSLPFWHKRQVPKGNYYKKQHVVCKDLGIVVKGVLRIYYADPVSQEEKNMYFFSEGQFVVSFRSFINQDSCNYYIDALEDAEIVYITHQELHHLYLSHQPWERFGRRLAEHFFNQSQGRAEQLLFLSHEQRYLQLLAEHPNIVERIASFHIASYLGIKNPSLSRIKKRITESKL